MLRQLADLVKRRAPNARRLSVQKRGFRGEAFTDAAYQVDVGTPSFVLYGGISFTFGLHH